MPKDDNVGTCVKLIQLNSIKYPLVVDRSKTGMWRIVDAADNPILVGYSETITKHCAGILNIHQAALDL